MSEETQPESSPDTKTDTGNGTSSDGQRQPRKASPRLTSARAFGAPGCPQCVVECEPARSRRLVGAKWRGQNHNILYDHRS